MDFVDDLDGLSDGGGGLKGEAMAVAVGGGGAALGIVASNAIVSRIPWVKERWWARLAAHLLVGGIGGSLLARRYKAVGAGFAFGVAGFAAAKALVEFVPAAGGGDLAGYDGYDGLDGLGGGVGEAEMMRLAGGDLGNIQSELRSRSGVNGLGNIANETRVRNMISGVG